MKDTAEHTPGFLERAKRFFTGRFSHENLPLSVTFGRFRRVLDSHNRAVEIISDMGEKLGGDYLFDIVYLRAAYTELRANIGETIDSFDLLTQGKFRQIRDVFGRIDREVELLLFPGTGKTEEMVLFFEDITWDRGSAAGGKIANLAVLQNDLKLRVPDGFAITTRAFDEFMVFNGIDRKVSDLGQKAEISETELQEIRAAIVKAELPQTLDSAIDKALEKLMTGCKGECSLAIRSSAEEEDREYSFAGQYETVLNVPPEGRAVREAYKQVLASLFTVKSLTYHMQAGQDISKTRMAVGCLFMVDAMASGVLYSSDPGGRQDTMLIASTWGLGEAIVEGKADADLYWVRKGPAPAIDMKKRGGKSSMVVQEAKHGVKSVDTPPEMARQSSLTDLQVLELASIGAQIEGHFRGPQDIEWALDGGGRFTLLQSRPLRTAKEDLPGEVKYEKPEGAHELMRLEGLVVQPGAGAGKIFIFKHMDDLEHFPRGAVLVAHQDSSDFVRIMPLASAIITDVGTPTSHMAAICREFRIPTVVNTGFATLMLRHGQEVTLSADDEGNAVLYEGTVEGLLEEARSGTMRMDELYEFRKKRYVLRFIVPLHLIDPMLENFLPEGCRTMHDILRFVHEKSVARLIESARDGARTKAAVKLDLPVPTGIMVADIGGGLKDVLQGKSVTFDNVASVPFRAILKGMMHPGAWHAEAVSLNAQDFFSSMMRMPDIVTDSGTYLSYNVAVISHDYVNLNLRFGYHYNMMDCFCSDKARNNHIYFRFTGGATDISKRSRRIELIARILNEYGFSMKIQGDLIVARLSNIGQAEMEQILDQTGRLIAFTRQLDAVLHDDESVGRYTEKFLSGDYTI